MFFSKIIVCSLLGCVFFLSQSAAKQGTNAPNFYVALSVNIEPSFLFFAPMAIAMWRRCGIEPLLFISSSRPEYINSTHGQFVDSILRLNLSFTPIILDDVTEYLEFGPIFLATIGRIAVAITPTLFNPNDVIMMGDIDVLPVKCEYFKSIPRRLKSSPGLKWFADRPMLTEKRFAMCYIAARATDWSSLLGTEHCKTLQCSLKALALTDNFKEVNIEVGYLAFDELFIGKHIYELACFPGCVTQIMFPQKRGLEVRDYSQQTRGPWHKKQAWWPSLHQGIYSFYALSKMIEVHIGPGPFSMFGRKNWVLLTDILHLYIDDDRLLQLFEEYQNKYYTIIGDTDYRLG